MPSLYTNPLSDLKPILCLEYILTDFKTNSASLLRRKAALAYLGARFRVVSVLSSFTNAYSIVLTFTLTFAYMKRWIWILLTLDD